MTTTNRAVGTPSYMSPEQIEGGPVDARSDLFSVGCVLYAMGSGRSPFHGSTYQATIRKVFDERPRPLIEVNPRISSDLSELVDRLLERDPDRRPQTASELETRLK